MCSLSSYLTPIPDGTSVSNHADFLYNGYCDFFTGLCTTAVRLFCPIEPPIPTLLFNAILGKSCAIHSIEGNQKLAESKVVFLADLHNDHILQLIQQEFLNIFASENDFLLHEGVHGSFDYRKAFDLLNVNKDLQHMGWENPEHLGKVSESIKKLEENWRQIELGRGVNQSRKAEYDKALFSYDQTLVETIKFALNERNDVLAQKIQNILPELKANQKIFVKAGIGHFTKDLLSKFSGLYTLIEFKEFPVPKKHQKDLANLKYSLKFPNNKVIEDVPVHWFNKPWYRVKLHDAVQLDKIMEMFFKAIGFDLFKANENYEIIEKNFSVTLSSA